MAENDRQEKVDGRWMLTSERLRLKAEAKKARRDTFRGENENSRNELPEKA